MVKDINESGNVPKCVPKKHIVKNVHFFYNKNR